MSTITINPSDVASASNFLEQVLSDAVPGGDFSRGTALRDLTIGAIAVVYAHLQAVVTRTQATRSLRDILDNAANLDADELRDAVVAILSNLGVTPAAGKRARVEVVCHANSQVDVFVQPTHQFTYAPGLIFGVDSDVTYTVPSAQLLPVLDPAGRIVEYTFTLPLVAGGVGEAYNVEPAVFTAFDPFSLSVFKVESLAKAQGGLGPEEGLALAARAPDTLATLDLINERAIRKTLSDAFPDVRAVTVVQYGDPEMERDRAWASNALAPHVGGRVDIYPLLDLVETTFVGVVGAPYARPDGIANILRDADGTNLSVAGRGDVVRIVGGIPGAPREFLVLSADANQIVVSENIFFPRATDELTPPVDVQYTVGRVPPAYTDVLSVAGFPLPRGRTSRTVSHSGRVTLPGLPIMDILDVAILNPPVAEAAYLDPVDRLIHFVERVSQTPQLAITPTQPLQYRVVVNNPLVAQSTQQWAEIEVGQNGSLARYDGLQLRVRYRTVVAFATLQDFVSSRTRRVNNADHLIRGHYPVTLTMVVTVRTSTVATAPVDYVAVTQAIVALVNGFDTSSRPIDVSAISTMIRDNFPNVSAVFPFRIDFTLATPNGDLATFQTSDEVRLDARLQRTGPPLDRLGSTVSPRVVRYLTSTANIEVLEAAR